MNPRKTAAIDLLLAHPEPVVAEMMGIRLTTLRRWMRDPEFTQALRERERQQAEALGRITRGTVLEAVRALRRLVADPAKPDLKAVVDVLKASGAFEQQVQDPGAALAEIIASLPDEE